MAVIALSARSLVPVVWAVVAVANAQRGAREKRGLAGPDSPDEDASWKLGLFHYNTANASWLVPKRNGIGYTVNLGHPAGMAFMVATGVVLLVTVAWGLLIG
nr:DUF5808 domain-containing protein [Propionibacterium cyclohexanicum]